MDGKGFFDANVTSSVNLWLTKEHSMQPEHIFGVNDKVYTATEGDGQNILYVEELLKNGRYKLRRSQEAGRDVLRKMFREDLVRENALN